MTADRDSDFLPGDENAAGDVLRGDYEVHRKLVLGNVVIDLGAHIGTFSRVASKAVGGSGQVIAFEPNPRNHRMLDQATASLENVVIYQLAALNINSRMPLWRNKGNSGGHSLFDKHEESDTVSTINIGAFVLGMERPPDFIKIDTEGSELSIVGSLLVQCESRLRDRGTHIAMEVHCKELSVSLKNLFDAHGWKFYPKDVGNDVGMWYADPA